MTAGCVDRWRGLDVVVVGGAALDIWMEGVTERLCREAPVPVVAVRERTATPGGAANAALNVAALGGRPRLLSVVGDDTEGRQLCAALEAGGVDVTGVVAVPARSTLALHRVSVDRHLVARFDVGSATPPDPADLGPLVGRAEQLLPSADAVLLSDYGYGLFGEPVVDAVSRTRVGEEQVLVVDSKHPARFRDLRPTAVKPNWREAVELLGSGELDGLSERADGVSVHGSRLLETTGSHVVALTLDRDGAIVFERGRPPHRTYARPAPNTAATGAGDTYVAALTLALAAGLDVPSAAEAAAAAARVVVAKQRTATCSGAELTAELSGGVKRLRDLRQLASCVGQHRGQGRRIVFTNGCFDLLHRGHITYLNRAKTLGDVLVVGVNDDDSVRRLKGPGRPINPLDDRLEVLAALSCVDHVISFAGDSPTDLIDVMRPDIYAKGGDYTPARLPEAPVVEAIGGEVRILPFMEDRSTTGLLDRIRSRAGRRGVSFDHAVRR